MKHLTLLCIFIFFLAFFPGCSRKQSVVPVPQVTDYPVTCIGVLPAQSALALDKAAGFSESRELQKGVVVMDTLLRQLLGNQPQVRFVSGMGVDFMDDKLGSDQLTRLRAVGSRLSCNALLVTTVKRYRERVGGPYTAKEPAAVAFSFRLVEIEKGRALCRGQFEERQQSVMENLYSFKTARSRGFTWVTAEELMREGLREKLQECTYLRVAR